MIDTVEIENFQSHKSAVLSFAPGLNVIKGRSHSGKSSVMRALRWALLNQPRGTHFVSHFKGDKEATFVGVEFEDARFVSRERGGSVENGYNSSVGSFRAIRSGVPEEIQEITQMNEINIQTQGDPYFMLNKSSGQVATEINKLVGLDIIDETLGKLNRLENEAGAKLNVLEEVLDKENEELEELSFVDDLEVRVVEIEDLWGKYNVLQRSHDELSNMIKRISLLDSDMKRIDDWLTIVDPVNELTELIKEHNYLAKSYTQLNNAILTMQRVETSLNSADSLVGQLSSKLDTLKKSKEYQTSFCKYCGAHTSHWRND